MGIIRNLLRRWSLLRTTLKAESNWVTVFESMDEYSVHIHKLKLEDHGIPASVFNQQDSSYKAFGYIYLVVPKEYEGKARDLLIKEHE